MRKLLPEGSRLRKVLALLLAGTLLLTLLPACAAGNGGAEQGPPGFELHEVLLPSSDREKTEYNAEIYGVEPFTLSLYLPEGWSIQERAARQQAGESIYQAVDGIFSVQCILDEAGTPVGSIGYTLAPQYEEEAAMQDPMALFAGITLAEHYFDCKDSFREVNRTEGGLLTGLADVVDRSDTAEDGKELSGNGLLARDEQIGVYVAVEFALDELDEEQLLDVAENLRLSR